MPPTQAPHRILLVHGHDLKPAEAMLRELSVGAIRSGVLRDYPDSADYFDRTGMDMVYYGDLINGLLLADGRSYDEELDVGDRRNALAALQGISQRKKFGFRQYDALPGKTAAKEFLADIGAPVMGVLGLTMPLINWAVPDLAAYLKNADGFGSEVRRRIRDKLIESFDAGERLMVISHGLGSVAAFDVLWQLSRDERFADYAGRKIDSFVTMGSPLCDNFLRRYLLGAKRKGVERYPNNIISWQNLAAEDDYICHDGTIADDLAAMMKHRLVSQVRDFRVYNQAVRYGRSNPHSSVGYYIHPRLSKIVHDWIRREDD